MKKRQVDDMAIRDTVKKKYRKRVIDSELSDLLKAFGGVLIVGPKWCGKSWTASRQSKSEIFIDMAQNRERALLLPESVLEGETPRLIDEWQDAPILWDAARREIDSRHAPGQFIFTGSTAPPKEKTSHTGTGRFARLRMRTLSLFESGDSTGHVSLKKLFSDGAVSPAASPLDFPGVVALMCKGGWPASFWVDEEAAYRIPKEYINAIAEVDMSAVDGVAKNPSRVAQFLRSLARNTATEAKMSTIGRDMREDGNDMSGQTVRSYYDALKRLYAVEEQDAWLPSLRSKTRMRTSPKRHFADPSLAVAALGATPSLILQDVRTAGFLFESMCYRDISVYAEAIGGKVFYYRDENGLEADAIIQLPDGRWAAIEVKLGTFEFDAAAANLISLREKLSGDVSAPSFLAILTATSGMCYERDDGVLVIPLDLLGP
ncbi:MAG: DUF4143 domain-containing protein [Clostridiales Family XIII bacterium]|jgi:predicted AAA+ superfamily ATPase|nr:DUF4143 domain-containing protein [Clostridiales Family XIII bacterium]